MKTDATDLIAAMRQEITRARQRVAELRSAPVSREWAEELETLEFRADRLARRVELLEAQGLLSLIARRTHSIGELMRAAIDEVAGECQRRGIRISLEVVGKTEATWVDVDQLLEAYRCLLDDLIARVDRDGDVTVRLQSSDSTTTVRVEYVSAGGPGDGLATEALDRLAERLRVTVDGNPATGQVALSVPHRSPGPVSEHPGKPRGVSRRWVFPKPGPLG